MLVVLAEILVVMMLVMANGVLAGSEMALVSADRTRLRSRAESGDARATAALELTESPNRFLSTVQIGITVVGVTAGAFGGTALAGSLTEGLTAAGMSPRRATGIGIAVVVGAIMLLTLVLGELVPKRLALANPEGASVRVARPMRLVARLATPLVHLLSEATDLVLRLLPWKVSKQPTVTAEDIERLVAEATASGILERTEQDVVRRLFRLSDRTVDTLMTPRERIAWLDMAAAPGERHAGMIGSGHSRFILCDGELDRVRGYVKVQDLLDQGLRAKAFDAKAVLRRPHFVSPWTPAFRILERFQRSGDHIAIVRDASGSVVGLVTLNDILENIVGDFPEPHEMQPPSAVQRTDGSWLVDGLLPMEDTLRRLGRPRSAAGGFPTIHAFVVHHLGEDPAAADAFAWEGMRFEVVDMDGSRVDKVLVQLDATSDASDARTL
ncbi:MAG: hemolysin family protein [Gemmatimonadota bacterium]|nr:hemolysin family protein [Gemmatimonadota bacterium]